MGRHIALIAVLPILAASLVTVARADTGDADAGKLVFHQCQACHAVKQGINMVGPSLWGVVGRRAASLPGYSYSGGLKKLDVIWDGDHLDAFLAAPGKYAPGNKMPFVGLKAAPDRANVIAYLQTLK
jgi:cytochrome c